jgi:hypothetical protein
MKVYTGMEIQRHEFLISSQDGGKWATTNDLFVCREKDPGTQRNFVWMLSRREKSLAPNENQTTIPRPSIPYCSHYKLNIYRKNLSSGWSDCLTASIRDAASVRQKMEATIRVKVWKKCLLTWQQAPGLKDRQEGLVSSWRFTHGRCLECVKLKCG